MSQFLRDTFFKNLNLEEKAIQEINSELMHVRDEVNQTTSGIKDLKLSYVIRFDQKGFVLLLGTLLIKRTRSFILDWIPFLFILIAYDFLRSLAPILNPRVHYFELIWADQTLFRSIPTISLQNLFWILN